MPPDELTAEALDAIIAETADALSDPEAIEAFLRCSECGGPLAGRMDTRTCSDRCRQRRSRRRRRAVGRA